MPDDNEIKKGRILSPSGTAGPGETSLTTTRAYADMQLPVDRKIWRETRRIISARSIRVEAVATCAAQDPVLVLELLKTANAMFFSGDRAAIASAKTAIVRLGSQVVLEMLDEIDQRPDFRDMAVSEWFEVHRRFSRRTSIVARIIAEAIARQLADECQTAGLMAGIGDMLAVARLQEKYVQVAAERARASVNYYLNQTYGYDVERTGIEFLRKHGVPEGIIFVLDREARPRSTERAVMRPVCWAAHELVDAFDSNRWEKLAPGRTLPPKSYVRMLQMTDNQYLRIYERAAEYLFSDRLAEENPQDSGEQAVTQTDLDSFAGENDLASDIADLMSSGATLRAKPDLGAEPALDEFESEPFSAPADAMSVTETIDQFALEQGPSAEARQQKRQRMVTPPPLRTDAGNAVVAAMTSLFERAKNSEELLLQLLVRLVEEAHFEKAALICVSKDRRHAIVVAARGGEIGNGQRLSLEDPLSPLAQCFSKVQSFGNRENESSPFGSKAFALAPIDVDHDTPVALYADCGATGSLTLESRRIFRVVVNLLNQKLPTIPGGLPVELEL